MAAFVREHPQVLETYKRIQGARGALEHHELEKGFNERDFATALKIELRNIKPGKANANAYEVFIKGLLTFLFYPDLITPIKSYPINDGRKIVDIKFTNAAQDGFFKRMLDYNQTRAASVVIECKNYHSDPQNPEIDQLLGRFDPRRGYFGMLVCRKIKNRDLMQNRCLDAAKSERGFVLALDDDNLEKMLDFVAAGKPGRVGTYLGELFDRLQR